MDSKNSHYIFFDLGLYRIFFLYFFFGILSDVWTDIYKTIITGVHFVFSVFDTFGLAVIIKSNLDYKVPYLILFSLSYILILIEYCRIWCNFVQLRLDQILSVSDDKISDIVLTVFSR